MKTEVEKSSFLRVSINQRSPSLFPPGGPFTLLSPPLAALEGLRERKRLLPSETRRECR